ncbi:MAG: FxSxx-COOH system tetratricopeptide repeat protein [Acidobacteriota bacterium]
MAMPHEQGQAITFYSYKGGTGRSMALANIACLLARNEGREKGVLMVDWDLEAPGLHRYFYNHKMKSDLKSADLEQIIKDGPGMIDLFLELNAHIKEPIPEEEADEVFQKAKVESFIMPTGIPNLSLIKAGRFDERYSHRVTTFPWNDLYQRAPWLFRMLAKKLTERYAYVLVDSRTGLTDTSGICTSLFPDKLVVVFTPNRQSILGSLEVISEAARYRRESDDLRPFRVFPLPSRIDVAKPKLFHLWRKGDETEGWRGYQPLFEDLFREVYDLPTCSLEEYFDEVQIQHISDYAYGEEIASVDEGSDYRLSLKSSYENFKAKLVSPSGPWEQGVSSVRPPLHIWNIPNTPNPNFTGHQNTLTALREELQSKKVLALTGLGGVGKTQLAVEYAQRYGAGYSVVWWMRAEEPATLNADYAALAKELGLPQKDDADQRTVARAVRQWLLKNTNWLLVFDNAPELASVSTYILPAGRGHMIITSRDVNWRGVASVLPVEVLERTESVSFLLKRTAETDGESAKKLAEELGDLPLALEQAGAYIEETGSSLTDYLELFRTHRQKLLEHAPTAMAYPQTVAKTWGVSFQQVKDISPAAADLMNLCAFMAPDNIPLEIIAKGAAHLPVPLTKVVADPLLLGEAVAALRHYSLVKVGSSNNSLAVHRLVQAVVRDQLSEGDKDRWCEVAVRILNDAFPSDYQDVGARILCNSLVPHALTVQEHARFLQVAHLPTAQLLNKAGLYLNARGVLQAARATFEHALAFAEATHQMEPRDFAAIIKNLGRVLQSLSDQKGARVHFDRALGMIEVAYSADSPEVAISLNDLGLLLMEQRDFISARRCFERALAINEAFYTPDHPAVAASLNSLGIFLKDRGIEEKDQVKLDRARECLERALKITESTDDPTYPTVARNLNTLGFFLKDQGDLASALNYFERALGIDQAAYGADHPDVARDLENIGFILKDQNKLAEAREYFERALNINEAIYGSKDLELIRGINNLGFLIKDQGDLERACELFKRALAINEATYGPEHTNVASILINLGYVFEEQGNRAGARASFERAWRIFRKFRGDDDIDTKIAQDKLAELKDKESG